jgi:NitT/TauT family transport system substrate-binding protein
MTMPRSTFLTGAAAAASATFMGPIAAAATTAVTIGATPVSDILPVFIAKDQGYFAKAGLDATVQLLPVGPTVVGAIRGGSIQFGGLTVPALLLANDGGLDLVAVCGASRESRKNPRTSVLARTGSGIKTAADFSGKRVGVPGISSVLDIMFRYWLFENHVDPKSVSIVETPFATMPDQLKSGAVDGVCAAEPFRSLIVKSGAGTLVANYLADTRDGVLAVLWCSTREWANAHGPEIAAFRSSVAQGIAYAKSDPDAARAAEAKYLKLVAPQPPNYDLPVTVADLQFYADVLKTLGMLRNPVDAAADIAK